MGRVLAVIMVVSVLGAAACAQEPCTERPASLFVDPGVSVDHIRNRFSPPMVSVTFDDAGVGEDLAAEDLEARRLRGTFYFTSSFIDKDALHLTTDQARRVVDGGHEIGDHTVTHPNLKKIHDAGQLGLEIGGAKSELEHLLCLTDIKSFAPPFGATNDEVTTSAIAQSLHSQRNVHRGFNTPASSPWALKSNAVNSAVGHFTAESPKFIHDAMREAIDAGGWFIIHFHFIVESDPALHVEYPRQLYDDILDDIAASRDNGDAAVVTVDEGTEVLLRAP